MIVLLFHVYVLALIIADSAKVSVIIFTPPNESEEVVSFLSILLLVHFYIFTLILPLSAISSAIEFLPLKGRSFEIEEDI